MLVIKGITKCQERAKQAVWWPGLSTDIQQKVSTCHICIQHREQFPEPLIPSKLPDYPWQKVGSDLFHWKNSYYFLMVDFYSRFIKISKLRAITADDVIGLLKSIFARHGIPNEVVSDNGPQYSSQRFADFSKEYNFVHTTSSPHYPQANGEAERAVRTIKSLLKKKL